MRVPGLLFVLLLAMTVVLGVLLTVEEVPDGHGFDHPEYPTMQRGGDGAARHSRVLWGGWALGTLQMLFFVALLLLGLRRRHPRGRGAGMMVAAAVVYLACFLILVVTYRTYAAGGGGELALSFPVPTAWMLYGVGFAPVLFILLYVARFESWILDDDELESFLAEARAAPEE